MGRLAQGADPDLIMTTPPWRTSTQSRLTLKTMIHGSTSPCGDLDALLPTAVRKMGNGTRGKSRISRCSSRSHGASTSKSSSDKGWSSDSLSYFDPALLVKCKEGTFKPSKTMKHYLAKHLRRRLAREEREALLKEHPLPDMGACATPKADNSQATWASAFPKTDSKFSKVQLAVLDIASPAVSAWQGLVKSGLEEDLERSVFAVEVLALCQRTLCMVGNVSKLTSGAALQNLANG